MLIPAIILIIAYILIAWDILPKVSVAMLAASIILILGYIPPDKVFSYIDFAVIFLLVSMMIIVHITSRSGLFEWIAIEILKKTGGNPKFILISLALFTAVLSAFLDNVTTVVLVIPVTFVISRQLKIDPVPFLITEIFASNIGGTATLIGDPPNIIIGTAAGLSFMDFVRELTPVILIIFVVSVLILLLLFKKDLSASPELMEKISNLDNSTTIKDKSLLIRSSITLLLVIIGFLLHDKIKIDAYIIAFFGASFLLLFDSPRQIIHEVEWTTIFFFIGLFILIGGFAEAGGIKYLADHLLTFTNGDLRLTTMLILWSSSVLSAIVDNIPYTATMVPLIMELKNNMDIYPLWWSLSLGACLGGNATIIGAAANVIVADASNAMGHPISFLRFMKYGVLITFISMLISSIYLYLRFFLF